MKESVSGGQDSVSKTNRVLRSLLRTASDRARLMVQWTSQCAAELNVWLWTTLAVFCSKPAGTQLTTTPSPRERASNQERLTSAHRTQAKKNSKVSNLGICIWWCLIFWISKLVRFPKRKKNCCHYSQLKTNRRKPGTGSNVNGSNPVNVCSKWRSKGKPQWTSRDQ